MQRLLIIILTTISLSSFGQQWIEYKIDSTLTVTIPDNYEDRDTLGQRVISSKVDNGLIIISIISNTGNTAINVHNEEELIDAYKKMREGFIEPQRGKLIEEKIIDRGGLKLMRFSYHATMGEEKQIRHVVSVFFNEKAYWVNFWEVESMTNEMRDTREKLFSSIKFPAGVGLKNQMSSANEGRTYYTGYLIGKVLGFGLFIAIFIAIVRWISKSWKKKRTNTQE